MTLRGLAFHHLGLAVRRPGDAIRFLGGLYYVAAVTLVAAGIFFALRSVTRGAAAPVAAAGE